MTRATVIIRTKNAAAILGQVLAALASQQRRDFMIRAVDSGSTDETPAILGAFGVPSTSIAAESYQPGPVLNQAIAATTTPLVVFCNSDTVPLTGDALERLLAPFANPAVAGTFARQVVRPDAAPWVRRDYAMAFPPSGPAPSWMEFSLPFAAIRRDVWERHPFYADAWASEDTEWGRWARRAGYDLVYVPEATAMHSHNYTFRQLWGRKFVEGEADAFIYDARPHVLRDTARALVAGARDALVCLRQGLVVEAVRSVVRRAVYYAAWHQGCRLGQRRRRRNDISAAEGQRVVLSTY